MTFEERIRSFPSVAPIPVSWGFGPRSGYGYRLDETVVRERIVYREGSSKYRRGGGDDYIIGPVGGFLLGSLLRVPIWSH